MTYIIDHCQAYNFKWLQHVAFLDVAVREGTAIENELLNKFGALRAKFIKCDITKEGELSEAYYAQVFDKYRRLDVVVNNSGIVVDNEMCRELIDVNFVFFLRQASR